MGISGRRSQLNQDDNGLGGEDAWACGGWREFIVRRVGISPV